MEEKIYERQVTKQAISKRVIDEQQIDRHYNQNDLQELYKYDLEPDDERILPILPKDRLFAEMLKKYEDVIYKYHEHDTLLENKEGETLNEEERKQAWEEFEAEKKQPQFAPYMQQPQMQRNFTGPVTSNNIFGIRTDVLLKLLSMKARLDNPTISDSAVKQAIPMLMQELYKQMDRGEILVRCLWPSQLSIVFNYFLNFLALSATSCIIEFIGSPTKLRRSISCQREFDASNVQQHDTIDIPLRYKYLSSTGELIFFLLQYVVQNIFISPFSQLAGREAATIVARSSTSASTVDYECYEKSSTAQGHRRSYRNRLKECPWRN
jgi:hypothetical protein